MKGGRWPSPRTVELERAGGWVAVPLARRPGAREGGACASMDGGKLAGPRTVDLERAGGWVVVRTEAGARGGRLRQRGWGEAGHPSGRLILSAAVRRSRSAGERHQVIAAAEPPVGRGDRWMQELNRRGNAERRRGGGTRTVPGPMLGTSDEASHGAGPGGRLPSSMKVELERRGLRQQDGGRWPSSWRVELEGWAGG